MYCMYRKVTFWCSESFPLYGAPFNGGSTVLYMYIVCVSTTYTVEPLNSVTFGANYSVLIICIERFLSSEVLKFVDDNGVYLCVPPGGGGGGCGPRQLLEVVTESRRLETETAHQWKQTKYLLKFIKNQEREMSKTERYWGGGGHTHTHRNKLCALFTAH